MSKVFQLIALVVIYMMTPGTIELTETTLSMVLDGDADHSCEEASDPCYPDDSDCSESCELCVCCNPTMMVSQIAISGRAQVQPGHRLNKFPSDMNDSDFLESVFRPPIG